MRYHVLAVDYDGTLASQGIVDDATAAGLQRLKKSGRRLVMVTGRELDELLAVCTEVGLFDRIVAENGAIVYRPDTKAVQVLAGPPNEEFVEALCSKRGVSPLSIGRVIVATVEPYHEAALESIRDLGLELQVIFNKGSVMILPPGVNKATGLSAALSDLGVSPHNVVGVGDAENDHAFLSVCGFAAAVENALPALKDRADLVTASPCGAGVTEVIDRLLKDEFAGVAPRR